MRRLADRLERQQAQGLYRIRQRLDGPQGVDVTCAGRRCVSFCSNDYLGLANHPAVVRALQEGASRFGAGSGASHLVSGHGRAHEALEEALAEWTGRDRALLFSTGYMANLGVLVALAGRGDHIHADRLNHASLIDAARLSGARMRRYPHGDDTRLAAALEASPGSIPGSIPGSMPVSIPGSGQRFIVTDGVFSMDGDLAPLDLLAGLAARHDAWLMVDDAHGLGVIGPDGGGALAHYGLGQAEVPILVGTLGKAFGTFGAFVAGSSELIETLIQFARSYIYTTALPPAVACAALAALRVAREEPWRREGLASLVERFRLGAGQLGLPLGQRPPAAPPTPIIPLLLGETGLATALGDALLERGLLVTAIRPPTVPRGTARLRITLSADHTDAQVDHLLETLSGLL